MYVCVCQSRPKGHKNWPPFGLGLSEALWASLGLSGHLCASLGLSQRAPHAAKRTTGSPDILPIFPGCSWLPPAWNVCTGGGLFSGFGALRKSGFPMCELLARLGTFWLRATRNLLEAFFGDLGPFKKAASQYVTTFWLGVTRNLLESFFGIWSPSKKQLANM